MRRDMLHHPAARLLLAGLMVLLIISVGGAFIAAIGLIPFCVVAARRPSCGALEALGWAFLSVMALVETTWALVYTTLGEQTPLIWAVPIAAGILGSTAWILLVNGPSIKNGQS